MFVDTNYFLRFLLNDLEYQHREVKNLFLEASEGKVELLTSTIVFLEIYWVLFSLYKKKKDEIIKALHKILKLTFIDLPEREILEDGLMLFERTNFDLEDCYNLYYAKSLGVKSGSFKTFDKKLEKEFNK